MGKPRPYRIIEGPAYPSVANSKTQHSRITAANPDNPHEFYHDESVRLSEKEMREFVGKPICVEHHPGLEVGHISDVWQGEDGQMWMSGRIYTDNGAQDMVNGEIDAGRLNELSVGYDVAVKDGHVIQKRVKEISLCKKAFFNGARVAVAASSASQTDDSGYMNSGQIWFKIRAMSQENSQTPAPVAAAPTAAAPTAPVGSSVDKDAIELARARDRILQEKEALRKELEELRNKNKDLETRNEDHETRWRESMKPELARVLEISEEQYKQKHGPESMLPEDSRTAITAAFMTPAASAVRASFTAAADAWQNAKLELQKERDARAASEAELKRIQASNSVELARINASHQKVIDGATPEKSSADLPEDAEVRKVAAHNVTMEQLFYRAPSEMEKEIYARDYSGHQGAFSGTFGVSASAGNNGLQIPKARTHHLVNRLPNSMRRKGNPILYDLLCSRKTVGVFTHNMVHTYDSQDI